MQLTEQILHSGELWIGLFLGDTYLAFQMYVPSDVD